MKSKIILVLAIAVLLGGAFYWFQWRPAQIRKECSEVCRGFGVSIGGDCETKYQNCLHEKGLKE